MMFIRNQVWPMYLLSLALLWTGCSNVKLALYNPEKRKTYATELRDSYAASPAGKDALLRQAMIETAENYLGIRYQYAGAEPKTGFDCSGFVSFVGRQNGLTLAHSSRVLGTCGVNIPWSKARPGDLMIFGLSGRIEHVALIQRNDDSGLWCVHATTHRGVISENVLASSYWRKRLMHAVDLSSLD